MGEDFHFTGAGRYSTEEHFTVARQYGQVVANEHGGFTSAT